jgi:hypothetical protein
MKTIAIIFALLAATCFARDAAIDPTLDALLARMSHGQRMALAAKLNDKAYWIELPTTYQILPLEKDAEYVATALGLKLVAAYVEMFQPEGALSANSSRADKTDKPSTKAHK